MFDKVKHKSNVINALSDCFDPMRSDLGNVHPNMRQSRFITASILGMCKAYAIHSRINENTFNVLVDAAFEEVFRHESISVQNRTEQWLHDADPEFMDAYYQAKARVEQPLKLDWLSNYAQQNFTKARTLWHPL